MRRPILAAALFSLLLTATAQADLLQLKDGRWVEGVKMRREGDAVIVQFKSGDVRVPLTLVEDVLIEGAPPPEPKTDEEKAKRAEGLVPYNKKWVKPEVRDKALKDETAKRKAEFEESKAHQEWRNRYKFETKNFKFESVLPPKLNEEYSNLMETYFEEFKKAWGVKVPKDWGKLPVCFYSDRKMFNQVGGAGGGAIAYYRFVAPRDLNFYYERSDRQLTQDAMFHEANHYLQDLIDESFQYPHWLGEAMAEYYGGAEWDPVKKTVTVGRVQEGRLAEIRADIDAGKRRKLQDYVGSETNSYDDYTWGWSFVHFMMKTPAYEKKFRQYFVDLAKAKDVDRVRDQRDFTRVSGDEALRVFLKRFGLKSLDALETEWYAYIDKLEPTGMRGMEMAGIEAYQQGRIKFRAPRQLKAAIDAGSTRPDVYIYYSRCIRWKGGADNSQAALDIIENAIKVCDPLCGDLWAERGGILYGMADRKDEGKKSVELAREINPENPYLDIEIAEAFAARGE